MLLAKLIAQGGHRSQLQPPRRWWSAAGGTLHFCVVGSGPSGFYTAERLLRRLGDHVRVDIIEALPAPFGLVRSGVAPDHPETKNVINQFTRLASSHVDVGYFGNVRVGDRGAVSLTDLRNLYHGVILACGAESDRRLGVPGEDLPNVLSAREFVWWYTGHPGGRAPPPLAEVHSVAVLGLGNVALDCARVLLRRPEELQSTDVAARALEQLRASALETVHVLARRGPHHAACTAKELREILGLAGVGCRVGAPADWQLAEAEREALGGNRVRKRVFEILEKARDKQRGDGHRTLRMHFNRRPVGIAAAQGAAPHSLDVALDSTFDPPRPDAPPIALPVQLVIKAIGYRGVPVDGAPFDPDTGTVPNVRGMVLQAPGSEAFEPGLFVAGWLKRGPSGIIGTNVADAEETVASIGAVRDGLPRPTDALPGREGLQALLASRAVPFLTFDHWLALDAAERALGNKSGKDREKIVDLEEAVATALGRPRGD